MSHIVILLLTLICLSLWLVPLLIRVKLSSRGNSPWLTWIPIPSVRLLEVAVGHVHNCCSGFCAAVHSTMSDAMGTLPPA